jgi:hypothetical protein
VAEPKENALTPASGAGLMDKIVSLCKRRVESVVQSPTSNHRCQITGGVRETECCALSKNFFAEQRISEKSEGKKWRPLSLKMLESGPHEASTRHNALFAIAYKNKKRGTPQTRMPRDVIIKFKQRQGAVA